MRLVGGIAIFIGGLVAAFLLFSLGVVDVVDGIPGTQSEPTLSLPTYLSFVSVMMTSVTVVLAAVVIGIGVVAFFTIREIKDEAKKTASKVAKETADIEATRVAADALSEIKVKEMVFELYAKAEKERQEEWGIEPENEER